MFVPIVRVFHFLFIFINCFIDKNMCDVEPPSVSIEGDFNFRIVLPGALIVGGNFKDFIFYIQDPQAGTDVFIFPRLYGQNIHGRSHYQLKYSSTGSGWDIHIENPDWYQKRLIVNIFKNISKVHVREIINNKTAVKVQLSMNNNGLHCEAIVAERSDLKIVACDFVCGSSITSVFPGEGHYAHICPGQLLFEETFASFNSKVWQHERRLSRSDREHAFVRYQQDPTQLVAQSGPLVIRPFLLQDKDAALDYDIDLKQSCTDTGESLCLQSAESEMTPPIASGRINTKNSFAFKYGVIEIRAKLPIGDWIYPELVLEPYREKYGKEGYRSGVVRVAFARGNRRLRGPRRSATDIGNRQLSAGVLLDQFHCHDKFVFTRANDTPWGADFHNYRVTWLRDEIRFSVDDMELGSINASTMHADVADCPDIASAVRRSGWKGSLAPFDQEFYISIGVGVGGVTDFPDDCVTGDNHNISWRWANPKARRNFWDDRNYWYPTWIQEKAQLVVQHVKVWAV